MKITIILLSILVLLNLGFYFSLLPYEQEMATQHMRGSLLAIMLYPMAIIIALTAIIKFRKNYKLLLILLAYALCFAIWGYKIQNLVCELCSRN
ncbi:hypothetical protein ACLI09_00365 [Flavobacterium sp. RHBU_24]|uniref:hypothetical protein n=1 Tax=Flavobacterium sp. RHBU_24 TaxID=3391185 RepID=UPI0039852D4D